MALDSAVAWTRVRSLPLADPRTADLRSLTHLPSTVRLQRPTVLGGMSLGVLWTGSQARVPHALGRVVEDGIAARDGSAPRHRVLRLQVPAS